MSRIRATACVEGLDEPGVRRIQLARVRVALALRFGGERHGADKEGIQQMAEHGVHGVLRHAVPLGLQILVQPMGAEAPGRVAQTLPHEPPQRGYLGHTMAFHHVAEQHRVHIALQ